MTLLRKEQLEIGMRFVIKTATYTATSLDEVIVCNKATAMTINLPTATGSGHTFIIKNINTGIVTVNGGNEDTIDGELTQEVSQWEAMEIVDYTANKWIII